MRIEGERNWSWQSSSHRILVPLEDFQHILTVKLYGFRILMNTFDPINNWLYWLKQRKQNRTYVNKSTSSLFFDFGPTMNPCF